LKVYISPGYDHLVFRESAPDKLAVKSKLFILRTNHDLRKEAVGRFLREEVRLVGLGVYRFLTYEVDEEKLKKMASLLRVDVKTKDIKESLGGYVNGELSLDEIYDRYLPLLIARKLIET